MRSTFSPVQWNNDYLSEELQTRYRDNITCNRVHWRYLLIYAPPGATHAELFHAEPVGRPVQEALQDLIYRLPDQEICWAVFNLPYLVQRGGQRNKNILITWVPESLSRPLPKDVIEEKMSSVVRGRQIKCCLGDITHFFHAEAPHELSLLALIDVACKFERESVQLEASLSL